MNDANRESIMKMVSDGTLRPEEAAKLLARLTDEEEAAAKAKAANKTRDESDKNKTETPKTGTEKITIPGVDGTERTIEVPSSLMPMIGKMVGEAVKQHTKKVFQESVSGAKIMALNKYDEVKDTLKTAIKGGGRKKEEEPPQTTPEEDTRLEARKRILQMVQNGRITASAAGGLIRELDALQAYEAAQTDAAMPAVPPGSKKR